MLRSCFCMLLCALCLLFASCGSLKQLQYVQGKFDTAALQNLSYTEPVIQKGDLLSVTVYSDNSTASALYNQGGGPVSTFGISGAPTAATGGSGYQVSQLGTVQLYQLGQVKAEGLTRKQLGDFVAKEYSDKKLLNNPFVEVRYLNFKITVMGDVNRPGVYTFPVDKVNIFDAIGMAGDLTNFAKRSDVLVIRENNDKREFQRLDLTNPMVFNSPFYYLQQNDLVIVDPTKIKATLTDQTFRNLSLAATILSIAAVVYSVFR